MSPYQRNITIVRNCPDITLLNNRFGLGAVVGQSGRGGRGGCGGRVGQGGQGQGDFV